MLQIAKFPALLALGSVQVLNQLRLDLLKLANGQIYHASPTILVPEYVSGNYGGMIDLVNVMAISFNQHIINTCDSITGEGCHLVADYANEVISPLAVDLKSAIRKANELKRNFSEHIASSEFHAVEDINNVLILEKKHPGAERSAQETDAEHLKSLVTELRNKMNSHFAGAFSVPTIQVIDP